MSRKLILKLALTIAFAFLVTFGLQKALGIDLATVENLVESFGFYAPLGYTLLLFLGLTVPFNPLSDFLTINLAAFLFPAHVAVVATFFAHCLALATNYYLAKKYGQTILKRLLNLQDQKDFEKLTKQMNFRILFGLRFMFPLTAVGIDVLSYASGIQKLPFGRFYIISIIPWTILNIAYFYSTSFFKEQSLILFFLPATVLIGLPLVIAAVRRLKA